MRTPPWLWKSIQKRILKDPEPYAQGCFRPEGIVLSITSRCNFFCKHCLRGPQAPVDMPFELIQKILDRALRYNYREIALTGGEPLLYPRFHELINEIVKQGYVFTLVTNGSLFKEHARFLAGHRPSITLMKFSLESLDPKVHDAIRQPGSHAKVMEAIEICRSAKLPVAISTAIGPHNFDEIYDIVVFGKKKGLRNVALTTMIPCPRTKANDLVLSAQKRKDLFRLAHGISGILKFPVAIPSAVRTWNNIRMCIPQTLSEISFNAQGELTLCCDVINHDLEDIRRRSVVSSIKDKSFDEVLMDLSRYLDEFQRERIREFRDHPDPDDIDFNSCFYCVRKLSETKSSPSSTAA